MAAIALAVGEVILPSFVLLGFAIGAGGIALILLVGGPLAVWLGGSLPVLLLVFAVVSLVSWLGAQALAGRLQGAGEDLRPGYQQGLTALAAPRRICLALWRQGSVATMFRAAAAGSAACQTGRPTTI